MAVFVCDVAMVKAMSSLTVASKYPTQRESITRRTRFCTPTIEAVDGMSVKGTRGAVLRRAIGEARTGRAGGQRHGRVANAL